MPFDLLRIPNLDRQTQELGAPQHFDPVDVPQRSMPHLLWQWVFASQQSLFVASTRRGVLQIPNRHLVGVAGSVHGQDHPRGEYLDTMTDERHEGVIQLQEQVVGEFTAYLMNRIVKTCSFGVA